LGFADVRVLHLAAVEDPDALQVEEHLLEPKRRAGVPRSIASDRGADVRAGVGRFRGSHPGVAEVCDVKHFAANRLKGLLRAEPRGAGFQAGLGKARAAVQQTEWAFVAPPALREKSRYLSLDVLLNWAGKARALLALPAQQRATKGDLGRLEEALGWLRGMDDAPGRWREWLTLTEEAVRSVRQRGLYAGAAALARRLAALSGTESGRGLAEALVAFVGQQQSQARRGERLPGSTAVLESLFGRLKAVQKEHSRGGVTALALALPALLGAPDERELAEALAATATADVRRWVEQNLQPSLQQKRCWLWSLLPRRRRNKKRTKEDPNAAQPSTGACISHVAQAASPVAQRFVATPLLRRPLVAAPGRKAAVRSEFATRRGGGQLAGPRRCRPETSLWPSRVAGLPPRAASRMFLHRRSRSLREMLPA
jgi:hypothetical protein